MKQEIDYEVTIQISHNRSHDFFQWLPGHIEKVLAEPGFTRAQIFTTTPLPNVSASSDALPSTTFQEYVVRYSVSSEKALTEYLLTRAPVLRKEAQAAFGEDFHAHRKILVLVKESP